MEGPESNRPGIADEHHAKAGEGGRQVRDWQRNTWYGPAPLNTNPFDEPEDAPELKASRSRNVNEHIGEFWTPHQPGYTDYSNAVLPPPPSGEKRSSKQRRNQKHGNKRRKLPVFMFVLFFLIGVIVILRFAVFNITEIRIIGNNYVADEEILRISGIQQGDNILSLNEKKIEQKINSDYRLLYKYLDRQLPHTVLLSVKEREACCWLTYCGILYVMDKDRMVLYETEDPSVQPTNLVEIKGLEIRSNTIVGQVVNLGSEVQQAILNELFIEMKVLKCTELIRESDISNTESLLLVTRDGYTVSLGNKENIHAKLRSMLLVREELLKMGENGGTINVSNPEIPLYVP